MNLVARIRLASGLVLLAFVATHLANHALGIISLAAMEAGREVFAFVWRSPLGTALLMFGVMGHMATVLWSLWRRRTWRGMGVADFLQIVTGFAIPPLLVLHVLSTRGLFEVQGFQDSYAWVLMALWMVDPLTGLQQGVLTVIAWTHACLGVHMWLRIKHFYPLCAPPLYTAALLLLVLGLAGFVSGGKEVMLLARDPAWLNEYMVRNTLPAETAAWVYAMRDMAWRGMTGFVIVFGVLRGVYYLWWRVRGRITIRYPDGRRVQVEPGLSVLEASRRGGIPHASICGGRGRCSTCRIRIVEGAEELPAMAASEERVLSRVGAPQGVRLACQVKPTRSIAVAPLLPPQATPLKSAYAKASYAQGAERNIAILFADLRSFTRFTETKLPFDVVFVMNRYCAYMGEAVEQNGGRLDKFIGDGVMALFGIEEGGETGARQALATARAMSQGLDRLNRELADDLEQPLRLGIGVHVGHVIVGEMGYRDVSSVTAIGDAVNTASRLETANKQFGSQLVFSVDTASAAGLEPDQANLREVAVSGREQSVWCHVLESAQNLPALPEIAGGTALKPWGPARLRRFGARAADQARPKLPPAPPPE